MFISLKANKKRILAFFLLVVIVVVACLFLKNGNSQETKMISGGTNEERVAYLQSFGWEVEPEPIEMREVMVPGTFNEVYTEYNTMQKAQGFDLKPYCGKSCVQYKYKINNYNGGQQEVYGTMLVYDNSILGGDVSCAELDGFMHGFAKDSAHYGQSKMKNTNNSTSSTLEQNQVEEKVAEPPATSETAPTQGEAQEKPANELGENDTGEVGAALEQTNGDAVAEEDYPSD